MVTQVIQSNPKLSEYQRQDATYAQKLSRLMVDMKNNPAIIQSIITDPVCIYIWFNINNVHRTLLCGMDFWLVWVWDQM